MVERLPQMTPREIIRALERVGFRMIRISGSHQSYHHPLTKRTVVIALHSKELKRGMMYGILKQAGVTIDDIRKAL
jgi:predicted RNA binding protein YcfA (HicA-like mRNA interferase family)